MSTDIEQLRERLAAYSFDGPDVAWRFSARLARENGWTQPYADRVVEEYKRFAFLSVVADHSVTPSEHVDQAWHLHLLYTESYWLEFCQTVLGRPLHHRPTRGGPAQSDKFQLDYSRTCTSYWRFFGERPPADIWPDVAQRFGDDLQWVRVNTAQSWIWARPRWWRQRRSGRHVHGFRRLHPRLFVLAGGLAAASCAGRTLGFPFDLDARAFFTLWLAVWAVTLAVAFWLKRQLRHGAQQQALGELTARLDPYDAAYLEGGAALALEAALASQVASGALVVDEESGALVAPVPAARQGPPAQTPRLDQRVYEAVTSGVALSGLRAACQVELEQIATRLGTLGLVETETHLPTFALAIAAPALGLVRIGIGISHDRPVGILTLFCLVGIFVACAWFRGRGGTSPLGHVVLERLKARHARLRDGSESSTLAVHQQVPWAVGLFGAGVLTTWGLDALSVACAKATLAEPHSNAGDTGGCGDGTNSGGGGGGCGGGGGGGGGCGGCGG